MKERIDEGVERAAERGSFLCGKILFFAFQLTSICSQLNNGNVVNR